MSWSLDVDVDSYGWWRYVTGRDRWCLNLEVLHDDGTSHYMVGEYIEQARRWYGQRCLGESDIETETVEGGDYYRLVYLTACRH